MERGAGGGACVFSQAGRPSERERERETASGGTKRSLFTHSVHRASPAVCCQSVLVAEYTGGYYTLNTVTVRSVS